MRPSFKRLHSTRGRGITPVCEISF
jgi:hypothetical protein